MALLNALDELQSTRMDDIVQTVNSILTILGGEITKLGEPFLKTVRNIMKERGLRRYLDRVTITYSSGSNQELTGALWNYIEHQLTIDHLIDPQIKFIRNEVT